MKALKQKEVRENSFIYIKAPKVLHQLLAQSAERNKQRLQDEFTKRLQASFNNQEILRLTKDLLSPVVAKIYRGF